MEITGTKYRAMVGSLLQAPWAVGYATLALIAYFSKSWQYIQVRFAINTSRSRRPLCLTFSDLVDHSGVAHHLHMPHLRLAGKSAVAHCQQPSRGG